MDGTDGAHFAKPEPVRVMAGGYYYTPCRTECERAAKASAHWFSGYFHTIRLLMLAGFALLLCLLPSIASAQSLTLTEDMIYCLESDEPHFMLTSPDGYLTAVYEQGPMKVRGRFTNSEGRIETRTYAKKHLMFLEPVKTGRIEVLVIPYGVQSQDEIGRFWVDVVAGTRPRPPPTPPTPPDDGPIPPAPVATKVRLSVVEDVLARTPETAKVLNAIATWNEFTEAGHERCFYDVATNEPKGRKAVEAAKGKPLPVLVISDKETGKVLRIFALPGSVESLKRVVREVAGE
jgi:hypothetical protein